MTDVDHHQPDQVLLDRLGRHLDHTGAQVPVRPASVAAAVGRARQRQRLRNVAVGSGSLAVLLTAITAVALVQQPTNRPADGDRTGTTIGITVDTTVTGSTTPTTEASTETTGATTPSTSTPTEPTTASAPEAAPLVAPEGADPSTWTFGRSGIAWEPPSASAATPVFITDDGLTWRPLQLDPAPQVWGAERDTSGVIRIAGAFTGLGATQAVLLTSADAGDSWTSVVLPIEIGELEGEPNPYEPGARFDASLATRGDTTVVAVNDSGSRRWLITVRPDGSVIDAADTGVDLGDQLPMNEATRFIGGVVADEKGFVAVGGISSDVTTYTTWTSVDGLTWAPSAPSEATRIASGRVGSELVSVGFPLSTSTDGITWRVYDLTGPLGRGTWARWTPQLSVVRDGQLAVLLLADGSQGVVGTFEKDGVRVEVMPNLDTSFYDAETGEYLGGFVGNAYDGPVRTVGASFELLDEVGNVRVSVSLDEATKAIADLVERPDEWAVASTDDLETWTLADITELVPAGLPQGFAIDLIGGRPTVTMAAVGAAGPALPFTVIRTAPL